MRNENPEYIVDHYVDDGKLRKTDGIIICRTKQDNANFHSVLLLYISIEFGTDRYFAF